MQRKHSPANHEKNQKGVFLLCIKHTPNFIRFLVSNMNLSYLNNNRKYFSSKSYDSLLDFFFSIYYHQTINFIESKIYKPFSNPKIKSPVNVSSVFFENNGMEFINISCILRGPGMKFLKLSKFPMPMMTKKLIPSLSTKLFNFDKLANDLDLEIFLPSPENLLCKYNNPQFPYRQY